LRSINTHCRPPRTKPAITATSYLIREAQRAIESIESLVRIHYAQEDDIYEQATSE
jgi:hypothetical protein